MTVDQLFTRVGDVRMETMSRKCALPFGRDYRDWFYIGEFHHDSDREDVNFTAILTRGAELVGREKIKFSGYSRELESGYRRSFMIVAPDIPARTLMRLKELTDAHEDQECIDQDAFWSAIDVYVQRAWQEATLDERIAYVAGVGCNLETIQLDRVPDEGSTTELWLNIWQDIAP